MGAYSRFSSWRAEIHRSGGRFGHCLALVISAMRASLVRPLHFMAIRALGQRRLCQVVVRPARAGTALGMSSFGVGHRATPFSKQPAKVRIPLTTTPHTAGWDGKPRKSIVS